MHTYMCHIAQHKSAAQCKFAFSDQFFCKLFQQKMSDSYYEIENCIQNALEYILANSDLFIIEIINSP